MSRLMNSIHSEDTINIDVPQVETNTIGLTSQIHTTHENIESSVVNNIIELDDEANNTIWVILQNKNQTNEIIYLWWIVSTDNKSTSLSSSSINNNDDNILFNNTIIIMSTENENVNPLRVEFNTALTDLATKTGAKLNSVANRVGELDDLNTQDKVSIVGAINSLVTALGATDTNIATNYSNAVTVANDIATAVDAAKAEILGDENLAEELNSIREVIDAFQNADSDALTLITTLNDYIANPISILSNLSAADIAQVKQDFAFLSEAEVDARATIQADARIDARIGTVAIVDAATILETATPTI